MNGTADTSSRPLIHFRDVNRDSGDTYNTYQQFRQTNSMEFADWYGPWAGAAIHKVEPGFDIVGTNVTNSGVVEVRMSKLELYGEPVLSIVFRRL